jgi:hypothetical protein
MRKPHLAFSLLLLLAAACGTVRYALPSGRSGVAPLAVSGRQGVLLNQRLTFGPWATGPVSRGPTRGSEVVDVLQTHGGDFRQRYAFELNRAGARIAQVECIAEGSGAQTLSVTWRLKRELRCTVADPAGGMRSVLLESSRDQPLAGRVSGGEGYTVTGSDRADGGRLSGTAGYTIARGDGTPVAAVDVTNAGAVYLPGEGDAVLAAVAAVLLLYQDPLQASPRFRDP